MYYETLIESFGQFRGIRGQNICKMCLNTEMDRRWCTYVLPGYPFLFYLKLCHVFEFIGVFIYRTFIKKNFKSILFSLFRKISQSINQFYLLQNFRNTNTAALLLQQPPATIALASRAIYIAAPTVWNSLDDHTRSADTFLTFKNRLKTELFKSWYV